MNEIVKRGPGRPRKHERALESTNNLLQKYIGDLSNGDLSGQHATTTEESMTPNEALNDVAVTIAAAPEAPKPAADKLYTFKLLKGANFPEADFMIVDVDEEGRWKEQRAPVMGLDYGPHTKVWPGTIVAVKAAKAKWLKENKAAVDVVNYE